jgi:predicted membrane-bound spermidine synthase
MCYTRVLILFGGYCKAVQQIRHQPYVELVVLVVLAYAVPYI